VVFFPQVSPLKPCMRLSSPPYVPHALPISVFLTWSPEWYALLRTFPENRWWKGDKGKGAGGGGRWAQIDTSAVERSGRRNPVGVMESSGAETQIKSKYRKCNSIFKHIIHSNGLGVLTYITSKHKSVTY
jgi:hypothetical protein